MTAATPPEHLIILQALGFHHEDLHERHRLMTAAKTPELNFTTSIGLHHEDIHETHRLMTTANPLNLNVASIGLPS